MKTYFLNIFEYDNWANKKLIKSLSGQRINDESVIKLLSHLVLAEQVWMLRLKNGDYKNKNFWMSLSLLECENLSNKNFNEYREYLNSLDENSYSQNVTYTNSKGIEFTNTIADTLTHIAFHSAYHRGQIAKEVRRLNKEPILTDYIAFVREGK